MTANSRAIFFSCLTIGLWGLGAFCGKIALEKRMAPPTIFFIEALMTAALAIPMFLLLGFWERAHVLSLNVYGVLAGAALAVGVFFYYFALAEGRISIIVPLTATNPVVSALLGYMLLGERPTLAQWAGITLIIAGALLLLSGPMRSH